MVRSIAGYALIGDCKTCALVNRDGSIDWLCLPRFDSAACFASLLGTRDHGYWRIAPSATVREVDRTYLDGTLILQTKMKTDDGEIVLTDFMPVGEDETHIVRQVRGVSGDVAVVVELKARFDYGLTVPWASRTGHRTLAIVAGPSSLLLHASCDLTSDEGEIVNFRVREGETITFILSHSPSHLETPSILNHDRVFLRTKAFWKGWSGRCVDAGRWMDPVRRSVITLKALSFLPTGGIVAAPTTSLPERIGGERNWDYRYCWLRDATFTLLAFLNAGYDEEANSFREWLVRAVAGSPEQIQIMYGLAGERRLDEYTLPWLPGFENSAPVRIGNAAAKQLQLDIYGELSDAMSAAAKGGLGLHPRGTELRHILLQHLETIWRQPDCGIWEIRGPAQHFTHSKVMAWVAFDRAADGPHKDEAEERRIHYRSVADEIHSDICNNAIDPEKNCFTQAYGTSRMDAGLLLLAIVGFLPPTDIRILNTLSELEQRLLFDGFMLRYETESEVDGLPRGEGAFLACSFWLVDNYILQNRREDAEHLFSRLLSIANDVGLFGEEYDPRERCHLGNFPQAFSHVALINTAYALERMSENAPEEAKHPDQAHRSATDENG